MTSTAAPERVTLGYSVNPIHVYIEVTDRERPEIVRDFAYEVYGSLPAARRWIASQALVRIVGWSAYRSGRYLDGFGTLEVAS